MKTCIACGVTKPYSEFYKRADSSDGYRGACKKCKVKQSVDYAARHREQIQEYHKQYYAKRIADNPSFHAECYAANREKSLADSKKRYQINSAERIQKQKQWAEANPDKVRVYKKAWKKSNPGTVREYTVRRRLSTQQQTPAWADVERIRAYYDVCTFFNEVNGYTKYHVDHIIPLRGKRVSGLHVHTNLRVIPARENERKNNRFEV